jgi:hypothetical protein
MSKLLTPIRVVGIEVGVVSGVFNLESSGVDAPDWRPRQKGTPTPRLERVNATPPA